MTSQVRLLLRCAPHRCEVAWGDTLRPGPLRPRGARQARGQEARGRGRSSGRRAVSPDIWQFHLFCLGHQGPCVLLSRVSWFRRRGGHCATSPPPTLPRHAAGGLGALGPYTRSYPSSPPPPAQAPAGPPPHMFPPPPHSLPLPSSAGLPPPSRVPHNEGPGPEAPPLRPQQRCSYSGNPGTGVSNPSGAAFGGRVPCSPPTGRARRSDPGEQGVRRTGGHCRAAGRARLRATCSSALRAQQQADGRRGRGTRQTRWGRVLKWQRLHRPPSPRGTRRGQAARGQEVATCRPYRGLPPLFTRPPSVPTTHFLSLVGVPPPARTSHLSLPDSLAPPNRLGSWRTTVPGFSFPSLLPL